MRTILLIALCLFSVNSLAKTAENLIVVTLDGVRWQEVFGGIDQTLANNPKFVKNPDAIKPFQANTREQKRAKLMPFLWRTIAKQGVLIGDRSQGSKMSVANNWYFSYPGYSEIFTGIADNTINSNEKRENPNISFLEWLNNQANYQHKLAAFGSWDVFPYIFNQKRSKLFINAGFMAMPNLNQLADIDLLNQLQQEIPSPWHNVRLDSFTYRFAKHYLLQQQPRVMTISLGETDDFAHDGEYDQYLNAAYRADQFIADLWQTIQSTPFYQNKTALLITTDHGRGSNAQDWQHHASKQAVQHYMKDLKQFKQGIVGSNHIWFAAIGAGIAAKGLIKTPQELKQNQIAATALTLLNEPYQQFNSAIGQPISAIFKE